jgi:hypothetical protein
MFGKEITRNFLQPMAVRAYVHTDKLERNQVYNGNFVPISMAVNVGA